MLISQFMGRLARANRADKSAEKTHHEQDIKRQKQTDGQTQDTGVIGLIQFHYIQTFVSGSV
jgi:hypothetical protein